MLTVEDGTGVANADSYISEADALAYHNNMGNVNYGYREDLHELSLRNATAYVDRMYGSQYRGELSSDDQSLLFPRTQFTDANGRVVPANSIPEILKKTVAELALVYIDNDQVLLTNPNKDDALISESISVGSGAVSESKTYSHAIKEKMTTQADIILKPLLMGGGSSFANRG
jgi:hypothetical protein